MSMSPCIRPPMHLAQTKQANVLGVHMTTAAVLVLPQGTASARAEAVTA